MDSLPFQSSMEGNLTTSNLLVESHNDDLSFHLEKNFVTKSMTTDNISACSNSGDDVEEDFEMKEREK